MAGAFRRSDRTAHPCRPSPSPQQGRQSLSSLLGHLPHYNLVFSSLACEILENKVLAVSFKKIPHAHGACCVGGAQEHCVTLGMTHLLALMTLALELNKIETRLNKTPKISFSSFSLVAWSNYLKKLIKRLKIHFPSLS